MGTKWTQSSMPPGGRAPVPVIQLRMYPVSKLRLVSTFPNSWPATCWFLWIRFCPTQERLGMDKARMNLGLPENWWSVGPLFFLCDHPPSFLPSLYTSGRWWQRLGRTRDLLCNPATQLFRGSLVRFCGKQGLSVWHFQVACISA